MNTVKRFTKKLLFFALCTIALVAQDHNHPTQESKATECNSAVSYALDYVGRFGDQLYNYIRAYYIAWQYNLPFYYKPFALSDQLVLSTTHPLLTQEIKKNFSKIYDFDAHSYLDTHSMKEMQTCLDSKQKNILYMIPFYFPTAWHWEEEAFHTRLGQLIKPLKPLQLTPVPDDKISIAVHVRSKNNSFDIASHIEAMPSKFPPYSFYLNGLKEIFQIFPDQPLYIYIFTDDPQPIQVRNEFYNELIKTNTNIEIECRTTENSYNLNVLEDFFSLMQFDCLIYPMSAFSSCAAAVSGPLVEITPPDWNVYSKDAQGNILIDNAVKIRAEKRKNVVKRYVIKAH